VHVPLVTAEMELFLLDRVGSPGSPRGHLAFYRQMLFSGDCHPNTQHRCQFLAAFFDETGQPSWSLPLNELLSRKVDVEIQDIRYDGGVLYLNESCFGSTGGVPRSLCGVLTALDPVAGRVIWRSAPLVSEGEFLVMKEHFITGFGQPGERARISLVQRSTGKVLSWLSLAAVHQSFVVRPGDEVEVQAYYQQTATLKLAGLDGPRPTLRVVSALRERPPPPSPSGTAPPSVFPFPLPPGLLQGLPGGLVPAVPLPIGVPFTPG
jgi:outer membrane protein assembly factor BamB